MMAQGCQPAALQACHPLACKSTAAIHLQDWVLRTGLDIALALQYLHRECSIVHRDV